MRKVDVNLDRESIKLKIKQLLKASVVKDRPLLIDLFTNVIMSHKDGARNLLLADLNQLNRDYYPVGTVVQFGVHKTGSWWSTSRKAIMLENPEDHGIKGDNIQGIIVDVYPFSFNAEYTVLYKGLNYNEIPEDQLIELNSTDLTLYEYE